MKKMVLTVGPPAVGKPIFCRQVALKSLVAGEHCTYVTAKCDSRAREAERALKE
jgi:KaiC/GvpD/RAD55 family RecA-like ATPase